MSSLCLKVIPAVMLESARTRVWLPHQWEVRECWRCMCDDVCLSSTSGLKASDGRHVEALLQQPDVHLSLGTLLNTHSNDVCSKQVEIPDHAKQHIRLNSLSERVIA